MKRFLAGDLVTMGSMGPAVVYNGIPKPTFRKSDKSAMPEAIAFIAEHDIGIVVGVIQDYVVVIVHGKLGVTMCAVIDHIQGNKPNR